MKITIKRTPLMLGFFALAIVACQVVAGIERVEKQSPTIGAGDGSSSGGEGGPNGEGGGAPDPCEHVVAAPLAATDDDPNTKLPPFWLAVRTVSVTAPKGFDLDGVCTCDTRPGTASGGASSCKPKGTNVCDEDGGIDNKGAALFGSFSTTGVDVDQEITADIGQGRKVLMIQVSNWNGKPNDLEVSVGIVISTGLSANNGCTPNDGTPKWCAHDKWDYPEGKVLPINGVLFPVYRAAAHVTNNQLVFTQGGDVTMFFGKATLTFGSPVMAGQLEKLGTGFKLTGALSGRIPITELLGAVGQFKAPPAAGPPGTLICESDPAMKFVRDLLCPAVDIAHSIVQDTQNTACDSISSTVSFTAEPAELGDPATPISDDNACSPANPANTPKYACP